MLTKLSLVLLLAATATSKQELSSAKKDQSAASDQVTSILVQPGPNGPRHVILSNEHQISSSEGGFSSRAGDGYYPHPHARTAAPPLRQVTYGPASPVVLRPRQQLYHHRGKVPHLKPTKEVKGLSEAIYKYSTYIKHDKIKPSYEGAKPYSSAEYDKPDYSVSLPEKESYKPQEGLSAYREPYRNRDKDEEKKFRESIGDLYNDDLSKEYQEKKSSGLPYSKLYVTKQHGYGDKKYYTSEKNYNSYNSYEDETYRDNPSGFDDTNGGRVAPLLARFYKQPLPIIQTQLPADNVGPIAIGYIQHYHPQISNYNQDEFSNNYFDYNEKNNLKRNLHTSDSEWTPINAPSGAVPAKSYSIPAPDLSFGKPPPSKIFRRGSDSASVVVGKSKQTMMSNHHLQGNSEGVVSAVVRVEQ